MSLQVYEATHDGQGNSLPSAQKQFISFSYGGKNIEDFNLLAVFASDRLTKGMYADFNETTTQSVGLDGQLYWITQYNPLTIHFDLSTDGMTTREYDEFKAWFIPGVERELILSEYPNRAIMARVSSAPQISMIPFEDQLPMVIGAKTYFVASSLYKGDITLELVCDDPFWYSRKNVFMDESDLENPDSLKAIGEDGVPYSSMLATDNILLAQDTIQSQVTNTSPLYFYNCGSAKSPVKISFSLSTTNYYDANGYICYPANSYSHEGSNSYETFSIDEKEEFRFTTPPSFASYNRALKIIESYEVGNSVLELRKQLIEEVNHYYTRAWVVAQVEAMMNDTKRTYCSVNGELLEGFQKHLKNSIKVFFSNPSFSFDSNNGEAKMKCTYKVASSSGVEAKEVEENVGSMVLSSYMKLPCGHRYNTEGKITTKECGKFTSSIPIQVSQFDYQYRYL